MFIIIMKEELKNFIKNCNFLLIMDNIKDTRNFASIIRSAAILGYKVIYRKSRGCYLTDKIIEISKGGFENTEILEVTNYVQAIKFLKENNFWIFCLDESGTDNVFDDNNVNNKNGILKNKEINKFLMDKKKCIIVGSEDSGASRLSKELSDTIWKLKTYGKMTTFNASVAAAIGMYEMRRKNE